MIHKITIEIEVPDNITEQELMKGFADSKKYNSSFGETAKQYAKRWLSLEVINGYKETREKQKDEIKKAELSDELKDFKAI